jgi:hypothetical protein
MAEDRAHNPARRPNLTVADLKNKHRVDPIRDAGAIDFINAKGLNKINKKAGESVAGNLERALDLAEGPTAEAREASLKRTHHLQGGDGATAYGPAYTSSEKYGEKYE